MKKVFVLVSLVLASTLFAQNPICIQVSDAPCDGNESYNSVPNAAGNVVEDLYVLYDTGSSSNEVSWKVYLDNQLMYEGSGCGCGSVLYDDFLTDNSHVFKVFAETVGCQTTSCNSAVTTVLKVYSPKPGNICHEDCD